MMIEEQNFLQRAASSAYASMTAFSAANNVYNTLYPNAHTGLEASNYFTHSGKNHLLFDEMFSN